MKAGRVEHRRPMDGAMGCRVRRGRRSASTVSPALNLVAAAWLVTVTIAVHPSEVRAAADPGATVASYHAAREAGKLGGVQVRAVADPRNPSASPGPVEGVTVALLPWSAEVQTKLDAVKAKNRDSPERYMASPSEVRSTLAAWARDLTSAGALNLVFHARTDADGIARFSDVPAGEWLLVAWREEPGPATSQPSRARKRDSGAYTATPQVTSYTQVRYWRSRLSVGPGETAEAGLTDRAVWLSAADPVTKPPVEPPVGTGRKHR